MRTAEDTNLELITKISYYTSLVPKKVDKFLSSNQWVDRDEVIRLQERIKAYKEMASFMLSEKSKPKKEKDGE